MLLQNQLAVLEKFNAKCETMDELSHRLLLNRPLRIKYGIDPTAPDLHLGHTVPLRLLKALCSFGHQAVIVIGDATALVGDPSGRDETRIGKTESQISENGASYLAQMAKVMDLTHTEIVFNNDWFGRMDFKSVFSLMSNFTLQQIVERNDFNKRIGSNVPIFMHELLYPIMQGWDSVQVRADIEIGGTEQLFNMNMGRDLQRIKQMPPQCVVTVPILRGTDGKRRMGKSLDNYVGISEPPFEMYSKIMSIPDAIVDEWFLLLTEKTAQDIEETKAIHHPMNVKRSLALLITTQYHDDEAAKTAAESWSVQFSKRGVPDDIEEVSLPQNAIAVDKRLSFLLKEMGLAASLNEARRLIIQGAVSLSDEPGTLTKVALPHAGTDTEVQVRNGLIVRVGRKIRKLKLV